jgi:2-iminobutanoate/2-iminopropanoate deaminase
MERTSEEAPMPQIVDTPNAPHPPAPIAQAVRSGELVFVSGITPFTLELTLAKGDFAAQMRQTMTNLGAILDAAGSGFDRVVKCTVVLARREDWGAMNEIYRDYFPSGAYPARTAFQALLPHPDFLVEVECVAELGRAGG